MPAEQRVRDYMTSHIFCVAPEAPVAQVHAQLSRERLSSAPVVDRSGEPLGIVSLSDMLRVGEVEADDGFGARVVQLPDVGVGEIMTRGLITLPATATLRRAARLMLKHRVHRVVVVEGEALRGVLSTRDVVRAVADSGKTVPVSEYMSEPVESVEAARSVRDAITQLDSRHHALIVTRDGRPVGVFSQAEALAARHLYEELPVEQRMATNLVVVADTVPVDRAARQRLSANASLVAVMWEGLGLGGVLSGTDFLYAAL